MLLSVYLLLLNPVCHFQETKHKHLSLEDNKMKQKKKKQLMQV